jgi:hypothetical protein
MRYAFTFYWNGQRDAAGRLVGFLDGYRPGDKLEIAYQGFVLIHGVDEARSLPALLTVAESLFAIFNDDDRRPACYRGPSMSVGNVVEIQGVCYAVASVGFERVEIWQSEIDIGDRRWRGAQDCPETVE